MTIGLRLAGRPVTLLNGGPQFRPNPSVSFHVIVGDAAAVDALHALLSDGGAELMPLDAYPWSSRYTWIVDRFGVSWQLFAQPDVPAIRIVPCLMFAGVHHGRAREAIDAYVAAIPDSRVDEVATFAEGEGGEVGTVKQGAFTLAGAPLVAMDGGRDTTSASTRAPRCRCFAPIRTASIASGTLCPMGASPVRAAGCATDSACGGRWCPIA